MLLTSGRKLYSKIHLIAKIVPETISLKKWLMGSSHFDLGYKTGLQK